MEIINLCLITDNNFVLPTAVTIESIVQNSNPAYQYNIYVICNKNVDLFNQEKLCACTKNKANISVIPVIVQDDSRYQLFLKKDFPVSISATFKFAIPELLPELEKVLYIDGDLIVQSDLAGFYSTDVSDVYAGVIKDYHALTFKGDVWKRLGIRLEGYFNSGVMLLNLNAMRADGVTDKLIDYRLNGINYYMDQDTLNVVFGHQVKYLDFKYNATATNWRNKTSEDLSDYYQMEFREEKYDYLREAEIIHYCSSDKPWKYYDTHMADLWYKYFLTSVFRDTDLHRESLHSIIPQKNIKQVRIQKDIVFAENAARHLSTVSGDPLVSVIIPAYNAEQYIGESIQSVLQSSFSAFELICVNDGSTDNTLQVIKQYAERDDRIVVLDQVNSFAGVARNNALNIARGQYVTFLDSDDLLANCALERLYSAAVADQAEVVVSGASEFEGSLDTLRPMKFWLKEEFLPNASRLSTSEMVPYLFNFTTGGPAGKMVSMDFVRKWNLRFLDLRKSEDFYFVQRALYKSSCISIVRQSLYYRRNVASSLEHSKANYPLVFFEAIMKFKEAMLADGCYEVYRQTFINENVARFAYNLRSLRGDKEAYHAVLEVLKQIAEPELGLGYFPACYYHNQSNYTYLVNLLTNPEENDPPKPAEKRSVKPAAVVKPVPRPVVPVRKRKTFKDLVRGGIKCVRDHGFFYTVKHAFRKACYWILRKVNRGTKCCLDHGIRYTLKRAFKKLFRVK